MCTSNSSSIHSAKEITSAYCSTTYYHKFLLPFRGVVYLWFWIGFFSAFVGYYMHMWNILAFYSSFCSLWLGVFCWLCIWQVVFDFYACCLSITIFLLLPLKGFSLNENNFLDLALQFTCFGIVPLVQFHKYFCYFSWPDQFIELNHFQVKTKCMV